MLGAKTAAINASACATAPLGPVIGLVYDGAIGMEGDRFPLVHQLFKMFMFQARISLRMSILWLSGHIYLTCAQLNIIGPPLHGAHYYGIYIASEFVSAVHIVLPPSAHNGDMFVVSEDISYEYDVLLPSDHNGGVFVVSQTGRDVHSVLPLLLLSVSAFIIVLLFLLLAVDLSTASVGAGLE